MDRFTKLDRAILLIIVLYPALLILISALYPPFWEGFVWKYYVAPIVADAGGTAGTTSYNPVDTTTYAFVLAASVYLIYRSFSVLGIKIDNLYIAAMVPAIALGSVLRALEDAELFSEPLQYLFISPEIYIAIGLTTYAITVLSFKVEDIRVLPAIPLVLSALVEGVMLLGQKAAYIPGLALTLGVLFSIVTYYLLRRLGTDKRVPLTVGLSFTTVLIYYVTYIVIWPSAGEWHSHYTSITGYGTPTIRPMAFAYFLGYFVPFILVYIIIAVALSWKNRRYTGLASLSSISMVFAHYWDAAATTTGINHYGYTEKHVIPSLAIELAGGNAVVMFLLKSIVLAFLLYFIEIKYKEEMDEDPNLLGLMKIAVIVLGLAPGTRDILRIVMGV